MARFPDGWVFIPKVSGPKLEDGELVETVSVDERELVMCKNCAHCYFASNRPPAERAYVCGIFGHDVALDFYCKNGEWEEAE